MIADLLPMLRCLQCRERLEHSSAAHLVCQGCGTIVPIVAGIPRFVDVPADEVGRKTQASFGYEWTHFNDWKQSGETNFNDYFAGFDLSSLSGQVVLDAGCGMGRHARQIAPFAGRVVAVDFSRAIDQAAKNVAAFSNIDCMQADLLSLPIAEASCDFVYSLGVLHHLDATERALKELVAKLKPGGRLRVYLYWRQHGWKGTLLSVVAAARRLTTKMPFGLLRLWCWLLSVILYVAVIVPYRVASSMGLKVHRSWPLFVYAKYPFNVLYNDQFDRFSAPLEKRYDPDEVRALLGAAGLVDVHVHACFGWIGEGIKP